MNSVSHVIHDNAQSKHSSSNIQVYRNLITSNIYWTQESFWHFTFQTHTVVMAPLSALITLGPVDVIPSWLEAERHLTKCVVFILAPSLLQLSGHVQPIV